MKVPVPTHRAPLERPAELDHLGMGRSAVIEASAGTGKTYLLEHLVLDLVISGRSRLDEILVVTFTERATAELVTRIRRKIDQALAASARSDVVGWTIDDGARARLTEARQSFDQAVIATIHSFCQRILTEEPFATRRLLAQSQVDGRQAFGEAFRDVLRRTLATDESHRGYLDAYLATGRRTQDLEEHLYRTATARGTWATAFNEDRLEEAMAALSAIDVTSPLLRTSLSALKGSKVTSVLEHLGNAVTQARLCLPVRRWGTFLAWLTSADKLNEYFNKLEVTSESDLASLRTLASMLLDSAPALEEAIAQRFTPLVQAELGTRKLTDGLYDYDDMIRAVDETLDGAAGPDLIAKLRRRFKFALVDEAQDTEPAQWRIFRRLFLDSGQSNPVALIGDPKQAIYGFRGADVHTYVEARDDIRARGGTVLPLRRNYRSTPEVIAAYNAILDHRAAAPYFSDQSIPYDNPVVPFHAAAGDGPGVTLLRFEAPGDGTAAMHIGTLRQALRDAITDEIINLRSATPTGALSSIYVVGRTNADAAQMSARLHEAGIPNLQFKPDYLFKSPEVAHVRALLLAIADPTDRTARLHAWLTPFFDLRLEALADAADPPADHPLMACLFTWKALGETRAYDDLWARILDDSGVTRRLRLSPSGLRRLTNYRHLFDVLHAEVGARPSTLADLAATLAAFANGSRKTANDEDAQRLETETDAVRIMTIHAAKGLEADYVFICGGFTARRSWRTGIQTFHRGTERLLCAGKPRRQETIGYIDDAGNEEDQRLLYVAMTRARKHLYLPFFPNVDAGESDLKTDEGSAFDFFKKVSGPYRHVNQRLRAIDQDPEKRSLFRTRLVPTTKAPRPDDDSALYDLSRWIPAPGSVASPAIDTDTLAALRLRRRGFSITSYSRMKEHQGGYQAPAGDGTTLVSDDAAPILDPVETLDAGETTGDPTDALPGGAASGLFLHGVLEKVGLGELPPLATWQKQPAVRHLIETELRRWDREPRHFDAAARLVHAALTVQVPMPQPDGSLLPGISRASRVRREVDFLFPLPNPAFSPTTTPEDRLRHDRGFVRGFLDVVFEHNGRVGFADWKSDVLPSFTSAALAAHVAANYELQVQLYTLALVRMLGIRNQSDYQDRFAGCLYLFLRGLARSPIGSGDGIHVSRPPYDDVLAWERKLATMPAYGTVGES